MSNLKRNKKIIKIAGAGPSGLTAAINLAKAGYRVEVYERASEVGGKFKENAQMLPNWFSRENVIEELEKCNIKIYPANPVKKIEIYFEGRKLFTVLGTKDDPIGYTVLRGGENSFEKDLAKQAEKLGVKIFTNFNENIKVDIIATGVKIKNPNECWAASYGRVYQEKFNPNSAKVFVNFKSNYLTYDYFYPHSKDKASLVVCGVRTNLNLLKNEFLKFKKRFFPELSESDFLYDFIGFVNYKVPPETKINKTLLVGEAAGFQDLTFGFGMRYAILSGYLVAKAIIENLNYDILWQNKFSPEFRKLIKFGNVLKDLNQRDLDKVINLVGKEIEIKIENFRKLFLSKNFYTGLTIYPFLKKFLKRRYLLKYFLTKLY